MRLFPNGNWGAALSGLTGNMARSCGGVQQYYRPAARAGLRLSGGSVSVCFIANSVKNIDEPCSRFKCFFRVAD